MLTGVRYHGIRVWDHLWLEDKELHPRLLGVRWHGIGNGLLNLANKTANSS